MPEQIEANGEPTVYPFIQMVRDVPPEIANYSVLPEFIAGADGAEVEAASLVAFGALGSINIFVGATNSGKSRFLRALAKCQSYTFVPSPEVLEAMETARRTCARLAKSESALRFALTVQNRKWVEGNLRWLKPILLPLAVNQDFNTTYDASFFADVYRRLSEFFGRRLHPNSRSNTTAADTLHLSSELQESLVIIELWEKEKAIQDKTPGNPISHYASIQQSELEPHFVFQAPDDAQFEADFKAFWRAIHFLRDLKAPDLFVPPQRIYIPTLRSLVSLRRADGEKVEDDLFASTIRHNYEISKENGLEIFTGGDLYDILSSDIQGTSKERNQLREFQRFLSENFFENRTLHLVSLHEKHKKGKHLNLEVEGQFERDLHDVGDGIGALIILMYRLFLAEPGAWIFIEEPELNLHPGLQRIFLNTLLSNPVLGAKNLRIFFTTHSNHLLRLSLPEYDEVSVFAFQRLGQGERFLIRSLLSQQHHALTLLGVANSSVLLANCGVWVEGVTDRQYLAAYLRAYENSTEFTEAGLPPLKLDLHYAFWEYAGSNLAHYFFADSLVDEEVVEQIRASSLCNRIFLLADRDQKKDSKHQRLSELERDTFAYAVTPGIEVENLISAALLKQCLPLLFSVPAAQLAGIEVSEKDYKTKRLGEYLQGKFPQHAPKGLVADSGTLRTAYKTKLASLVAEKVTWETMSQDAKNLTKRLYEFLHRHNKR